MKARIVDADALRAISPMALTAYAQAEGWRFAEYFGKHSAVYVRDAGPELIIPATDALGDYESVVSEIISILSRVEQRDELPIYRDLIGADRDVIRVRAPDAGGDGSVNIDVGVDLVIKAREMLLSAACSAKEARPTFRAGKIKEAGHYMDRVRLGQTEHGSFVITMLAPVPPSLEPPAQIEMWPNAIAEPFERLVTRRLADGLQATQNAAEQAVRGQGLDAFRRAVPKGVSANLCEALASLIERSNDLKISITWAKTRPTPENRRTVDFSSAEAPVLREAARLFRSQEPRPDEHLQAFVVSLDRKKDDETGRVVLRTVLDGQQVSVKSELPPYLYSTALSAHDKKNVVSITGDLTRKGHRWVLENPRDLLELSEEESYED